MRKQSKKSPWKIAQSWILDGHNQAKFLFLLLSVIMWLLIKLSHSGYRQTIKFPVTYSNAPEDKLLLNEPAQNLNITLKAQGFVLLRYSFINLRSLEIDINQLQSLSDSVYYWLPGGNNESIESQLVEGASISDIRPDTVYFRYSRAVSKKVPVEAKIKVNNPDRQNLYSTWRTQPDSIKLRGPAGQLKEVDKIFTQQIAVDPVKDTLNMVKNLKLPDLKNVTYSHDKVGIEISFNRLTEGTVQVPINLINKPSDRNIEIFPKEVTLTYRVALKDYEKVSPELFAVYADFSKFNENSEQQSVKLQLESMPTITRKVSIEPKRVEFIATQR